MSIDIPTDSPDVASLRVDAASRAGEMHRMLSPEYLRGLHGLELDTETVTMLDEMLDDLSDYFYSEASAPDNEPEVAKARILKAFNEGLRERFPNKDLPPVTTLSKAIDLYGLNQKFLHTLSASDEMALLHAISYVGKSRATKAGQRLSKNAEGILKNENTNKLVQNGQVVIAVNKENEVKMLDALHRSWLAAHVLTTIGYTNALDLTNEAPVISIDEVFAILMKQRYLGDESSLVDELRNAANIEELDLYDELDQPIKSIPERDLPLRLTDISTIENSLRERFGTDILVQYKELALSSDKTTRDTYEKLRYRAPRLEIDAQTEVAERSSDFSGYVFIEITKPSGETYVIADSPEQGNACYVVRSDIMHEMSTLTGKTITWEDLLRYPKETARQLGASRFYHTGEDTFEKALAHMEQPLPVLLRVIAEKWLTTGQYTYTSEMEPTRHNRLPRDIRTLIAQQPEKAKEILLTWLGQEGVFNPRATKQIGEQAIESTIQPLPDTLTELEQARLELAQRDTLIEQLKSDKAKLWAMLQIAMQDKSP